MSDYRISDYGALPDGTTDNRRSIQAAIAACRSGGGGRVMVPPGTYLSGSFELFDHVELHLERGAVLRMTTEVADFIRPHLNTPSMIVARNAQYVGITGPGRIDCQGEKYVAEDLGFILRMKRPRPRPIFLVGCRHVTLSEFTITDAPQWTLCISGCNDVSIRSIKILNNLKTPNSDGIDIDTCQNVRISDCHIEAGDDCIVLKAIKGSEQWGACENVIVRGCTLISTSAALIIGCECRAVMRDVIFDSCVIRSSHRGLAVHLNEEANVENVLFSNMIVETRLFHHKWWGRAEPIYVCVYPWTKEHTVGTVRNVRFVNVIARGENGVFIEAQRPELIQGVLLENVQVHLNKTSKWPGGTKDIRPWPEDEGGPGEAKELPSQPTAGFYFRNATDITVRNCRVEWGENRPDYYRHALESHGVKGLKIEGFTGEAAHPGAEPMLIEAR